MIIEEGLDGEAIIVAFATDNGPDSLIHVIRKLGIRLKVYKFLKDILNAEMFEVSTSVLCGINVKKTSVDSADEIASPCNSSTMVCIIIFIAHNYRCIFDTDSVKKVTRY